MIEVPHSRAEASSKAKGVIWSSKAFQLTAPAVSAPADGSMYRKTSFQPVGGLLVSCRSSPTSGIRSGFTQWRLATRRAHTFETVHHSPPPLSKLHPAYSRSSCPHWKTSSDKCPLPTAMQLRTQHPCRTSIPRLRKSSRRFAVPFSGSWIPRSGPISTLPFLRSVRRPANHRLRFQGPRRNSAA